MKSLLTCSLSLALVSVTAAQGITIDRAGAQPAQRGLASNFTEP